MRRRPSSLVLAAGIAVLAVVFGIGATSGGYHDLHEHGRILVDPGWSRAHPGPYRVTLTLMVDEEWRAHHGDDTTAGTRDAMERVRRLFLPVGIDIEWAAVADWRSEDDHRLLRDLLDDLTASPAIGTDLVIALTGQRGYGPDGLARRSFRHIIVRHHDAHLERDAMVIAHEIGHVLGADHHRCQGHSCLMAPSGFEYSEEWCPGHLLILRINAGLFEWSGSQGS